ncbi:MAG: hypothetical protein ABSF29_03715 [Tepidisphaeraceae bacterium]|jgi:hypothetical protein
MSNPRNPVALALYANAAVLFGILIVLLDRPHALVSPAFGDAPTQAPIAGGGGVYIMPCQLHPNVWGCFLLDVDHNTLCAYEYRAGDKSLVLTAARDYQYDLQLRNYDTFPPFYDVKKLVDDQNNARGSDQPSDAPTPPDGK